MLYIASTIYSLAMYSLAIFSYAHVDMVVINGIYPFHPISCQKYDPTHQLHACACVVNTTNMNLTGLNYLTLWVNVK